MNCVNVCTPPWKQTLTLDCALPEASRESAVSLDRAVAQAWTYLQLGGEHPDPEVEDRKRQNDSDTEAHAPNSGQMIFAGGGQDDEEHGHSQGSAELGGPSASGP